MKNVLMKMATSASAITVSTMLSMTPVFAASSIDMGDGWLNWDNTTTYGDNTWSWTDGGDKLILNGYSGTYISANGDLIIDINGANTLSTDKQYVAVEVEGDLTINGKDDASLTINGQGIGIYADEDVNINNATVEASAKYAGIEGANVTIKDSNVKAIATTDETEDGKGVGCGIVAFGTIINKNYKTNEDGTYTSIYNREAGKITIDNSNVESSGNEFAMLAMSGGEEVTTMNPKTEDFSSVKNVTSKGSIELINSTITSPNGAKVYVNDVVGDEYEGCAYIVDADGKVVKEVTIKKAESTASHRAAVNTGLNTDISLYVAAGLVALAGAEVLNSLKKKH